MLRVRRNPPSFLARPGCPTRYSISASSRLLGVHESKIRQAIRSGKIEACKVSRTLVWIPRSSLMKLAREFFSDRPLRLARILAGPKERMIALTVDLKVREYLSRQRPLYCSSPFALALKLTVHPCSVVVVDWELAGAEWSKDIAARILECPDRPKLVAILPDWIESAGKGWTEVLRKPLKK